MPTLALRVGAYPPMWPGQPGMQAQHRYAGGPPHLPNGHHASAANRCQFTNAQYAREPAAGQTATQGQGPGAHPLNRGVWRGWQAPSCATAVPATSLPRKTPLTEQCRTDEAGPSTQDVPPGGRSCSEPAFPHRENKVAPGRCPDHTRRRKQPKQPFGPAVMKASLET